MILNQLSLKSFGKFQKKNILLKEGINVVYGDNESGKSTVHTFLLAMFFGLRRRRGKASRTDLYTRYKPWGESSRYEGTLWFTCGAKQFRLERDFTDVRFGARLFCETDGELLSVEDGDLDMLLGNISELVFQNTVFVPQAKSRTEEGLYTELRDYLADFQGTGDLQFDLEKAENLLKDKKKLWEKREKGELQRKEQAETKISYDIQHEQTEVESLREKLQDIEANCRTLRRLAEKLEREVEEANVRERRSTEKEELEAADQTGIARKQDRQKQKETGRVSMAVWKIWTVFLAVTAMLGIGNRISLTVMTVILLLLLAAGGVLWLYDKGKIFAGFCTEEPCVKKNEENRKEKPNPGAVSEEKYKEWQKISEQYVRRREGRKILLENLQERETRLENLGEEATELRQDHEELLRIRREIRSITLAMQKLQEASKQMQNFTGGILTQKMSEIICGITEGKYRQVVIDEEFQIYLDTGETCLALHQVSYGTAEQVYLALRMACREILCREEELPLVLDETFAMYDQKRLSETLKYISRTNSQVLLFSCHKREIEALKELGISYHIIEL